jgi:hypothetical protein
MALVIYPMVTAAPKNMPFGLLSLDEAAETPDGQVDLGAQITKTVLDAAETADAEADGAAPVEWTEYASQEELDAALNDMDIYAAIVIPGDFSASRVEARTEATAAIGGVLAEQLPPLVANPQALADPSTALTPIVQALSGIETAAGTPLRLVVNEGKNPMAAVAIQTMMTELVSQQDVPYEVEKANPVSIGGGTMNLAQPFAVIPTFLLSLVLSLVIFLVTMPPAEADRAARFKNSGLRAVHALVASGLVGFTIAGIFAACGLGIPVGTTGTFLWLSSFALISLFVGCLALAPPLGGLVIAVIFGCGLAAGNLAYELLPTFYQDWFYPWAPQRFMGEGIREIFYQDGAAAAGSTGPLAIIALIGLAILALAPLVKSIRPRTK